MASSPQVDQIDSVQSQTKSEPVCVCVPVWLEIDKLILKLIIQMTKNRQGNLEEKMDKLPYQMSRRIISHSMVCICVAINTVMIKMTLVHWRKDGLFDKQCWVNLIPSLKTMHFWLLPHTMHKSQFQMD